LPAYEMPVKILIIEKFDYTATGKIDKLKTLRKSDILNE
jgi:hypothetical protein